MITIDLSPLRKTEALELAQAADIGESEFVERSIEHAAGNPLYLEQLLRSSATETGTNVVPGSVQSIVLARMDALDPPDRQALRAASVIGQRFSRDDLRGVLQDPGYHPDALLREVFIKRDGDGYLFAHALVQDAVYASLLKSQRVELHRRAAEKHRQEDPVLYAQHLERAGDERAPQAYLKAAEADFSHNRLAQSAMWAEHGRTLGGPAAVQHALACLHGETLRDLGEPEASIEAYEQARGHAESRAEQCCAWVGIASGCRLLDRYPEALEALEQAEELARDPDDEAQLATIHYLRGNIHFPMGNLEACLEAQEKALAYARSAGSLHDEACALSGMADALYLRGRLNTAFGYYDDCIKLCREQGFLRMELANLPMRAILHLFRNDPRPGVEDCRHASETAARVGNVRGEMLALNVASNLHLFTGNFDLALEETQRALDLAQKMGSSRFASDSANQLGKIHAARGETARAREIAEDVVAGLKESDMAYAGPMILGILARVTSDPERRAWALREGERVLDAGSPCHNHIHFREQSIETALTLGDWDEAERQAERLLVYFADEPVGLATLMAERGRAMAALGRGDDSARARLDELSAEAARTGTLGILFDLPR